MKAVYVLISGGFGGAYERLLPEFERTSLIKVTTRSGSSQGAGPQTIAAQLARGVSADAVILSREGLGELIAANRIAARSDVDLARVPLGVAVPAGTVKLDVISVEAFKQAMLAAKTIAVPETTTGIWLQSDLFSATRHRGKDYRQSNAARLGRNQNGRRATRGFGRLAGQRNFARDGGRFRRQPAAGDPVRSGVFSGRCVGRAGDRKRQAANRIFFFSSCHRSN